MLIQILLQQDVLHGLKAPLTIILYLICETINVFDKEVPWSLLPVLILLLSSYKVLFHEIR